MAFDKGIVKIKEVELRKGIWSRARTLGP